jgi:DNA polymerase III delta prime subunit
VNITDSFQKVHAEDSLWDLPWEIVSEYPDYQEVLFSNCLQLIREEQKIIQEYGYHSLKMAFGFISFDTKDKKENNTILAPLFLIPISMVLDRESFTIKAAPLPTFWNINPILRFYLKNKRQILIPETLDISNKNGAQIFCEIQKWFENTIQINDFDLFMTSYLGNFNYRNIWMVEDYETLIQSNQTISIFKQQDTQEATLDKNSIYPILPFDNSQLDALEHVINGNSLVIKGPPGTGKSQTIANIMTTLVAQGKKVLFVSEKKQAGQVLYNRLKSSKLHALCWLIYDAKEDKKTIQDSLRKTYQKALGNKPFFELKTTARTEIIKHFDAEISKMEAIFNAHKEEVAPQISFVSFLDYLQQTSSEDSMASAPSLEDWALYKTYFEKINQSKIPFLYLKKWMNHWNFNAQNFYAFSHEELEKTKQFLTNCNKLCFIKNIQELRTFFMDFEMLVPYYSQQKIELFDRENKQYATIKKQFFQLQKLQKSYETKQKYTRNWKDKWSQNDYQEGILILEKWQNRFLKSIHPAYNQILKRLNKSYHFEEEATPTQCIKILKNLENEWLAKEKYDDKLRQFEQKYPFGNFHLLIEIIDKFNEKEFCPALDFLLKTKLNVVQIEQILADKTIFQDLQGIWMQKIKSYDAFSLNEMVDFMSQSIEYQDDLNSLYPSLKTLKNGPFSIKQLLEKIPMGVDEISKSIYQFHLERFFAYHLDLKNWDGEKQMNLINRLQIIYQEYLSINNSYVEELHLNEIQEFIRQNEVKLSPLDTEKCNAQLELKEGWTLLEKEMKKKIRQKPIRELLESSAGRIIQKMKPIWLMNPSSVSECLPLEQALFDVVIFDEASQIKPEEAMLACYRGAQILIVGDEMQMPPSPYFQSQVTDMLDMPNNLLEWGLAHLPFQMLHWHYRSHYEALIHFSNEHFYQNKLITTPENQISNSQPIQLHYLPNGIYENRQNKIEAHFIAELLEKHLISNPKESIAIIALSQEQQMLIEKTIEEKAKKDIQFSMLYNKALSSKDEPLLIKNLENIQGEERDCIVISTCFGPTPQGKVKLHLGPINRKGGEKRLNVLFSRARKRIEMVASITSEHLSFSSNKGIQLLSQFLDFAKNNPTISASPNTIENPTATEITQFLRENGYEVIENVGFSEFKIPIAIRDHQHHFKACIWLDDFDSYESSNAWDSYFFKPHLLKSKGWHTVFVFSKDWKTNKDNCKSYILEAIEGKREFEHTESLQMYLQKLSKIPTTIPDNDLRYFYILESQSKFEEYTIEGLQLTIKKGVIDKKAKKQIQAFENESKLQKFLQRKLNALEKFGFERIFI